MHRMSHEHWLRSTGSAIAARRQAAPDVTLSAHERLTLALWLTADSMRRGGDLTHANETCPSYRSEGAQAAAALNLPLAAAIFAGSEGALERRFFELFEDLCREVRDICEA